MSLLRVPSSLQRIGFREREPGEIDDVVSAVQGSTRYDMDFLTALEEAFRIYDKYPDLFHVFIAIRHFQTELNAQKRKQGSTLPHGEDIRWKGYGVCGDHTPAYTLEEIIQEKLADGPNADYLSVDAPITEEATGDRDKLLAAFNLLDENSLHDSNFGMYHSPVLRAYQSVHGRGRELDELREKFWGHISCLTMGEINKVRPEIYGMFMRDEEIVDPRGIAEPDRRVDLRAKNALLTMMDDQADVPLNPRRATGFASHSAVLEHILHGIAGPAPSDEARPIHPWDWEIDNGGLSVIVCRYDAMSEAERSHIQPVPLWNPTKLPYLTDGRDYRGEYLCDDQALRTPRLGCKIRGTVLCVSDTEYLRDHEGFMYKFRRVIDRVK